jgi:hypothetical protein
MAEKTLTRETAIDALRALSSASAMVLDHAGTTNPHRTATIAEMERQLNVTVTTAKASTT